MLIGYTFLDPLIVLGGTLLAAYLLIVRPVRLVTFLPSALGLYFFIPTVTILTLWQTVPTLLAVRVLLRGKIRLSGAATPLFLVAVAMIILSFGYAMLAGFDRTRAIIRLIYYAGILGLLLFCYEVGRNPYGYRLFLKGLVLTGIVFAGYGAYQIVASGIGLPYRGIVRGTGWVQAAFEAGQLRINSFADEPKRLGYLLFVSGLACFFYGETRPRIRRRLMLVGGFVLAMSLMTFSGSYFLAVALFAACALLVYPGRVTMYFYPVLMLGVALFVLFPDNEIGEAIRYGYERRATEVEVGLDGRQVYRQEFFAWDFLARYPDTAIFGVGLGQYFAVLNLEYGPVAGINSNGWLIPLNSNVLELVFDFGAVAAFLFYASLAGIILRLRFSQEPFLALALLFLVIQSFTILTMLYLIMFTGIAIGRLALLRSERLLRGALRDSGQRVIGVFPG